MLVAIAFAICFLGAVKFITPVSDQSSESVNKMLSGTRLLNWCLASWSQVTSLNALSGVENFAEVDDALHCGIDIFDV